MFTYFGLCIEASVNKEYLSVFRMSDEIFARILILFSSFVCTLRSWPRNRIYFDLMVSFCPSRPSSSENGFELKLPNT